MTKFMDSVATSQYHDKKNLRELTVRKNYMKFDLKQIILLGHTPVGGHTSHKWKFIVVKKSVYHDVVGILVTSESSRSKIT